MKRKRHLARSVLHAATRSLRALLWRARFARFGFRAEIVAPAHVYGGRSIAIGARVLIWHDARLEAVAEEPGQVHLEIGDDTVIHPYVHIGAAAAVRIGRGVLIASHVYITDHDHDWSDPDDPVITNGRLLVAPVSIGDYVWLGERVMVLKGVTIGERSVVGAGSIVTRDIPAYSIAAGSPARVIRRFDRAARAWVGVDPA